MNILVLVGLPETENENLNNIFRKICQHYSIEYEPLASLKRMSRQAKVNVAQNGETMQSTSQPSKPPPVMIYFVFKHQRDELFGRYISDRQLNLSHLGFNYSN